MKLSEKCILFLPAGTTWPGFSPVQFTRFYALSVLEHKTRAGLFPLNSVFLTFHALTQSKIILSELDLEFSTQKETISSSNIFVTSSFNFQM